MRVTHAARMTHVIARMTHVIARMTHVIARMTHVIERAPFIRLTSQHHVII